MTQPFVILEVSMADSAWTGLWRCQSLGEEAEEKKSREDIPEACFPGVEGPMRKLGASLITRFLPVPFLPCFKSWDFAGSPFLFKTAIAQSLISVSPFMASHWGCASGFLLATAKTEHLAFFIFKVFLLIKTRTPGKSRT